MSMLDEKKSEPTDFGGVITLFVGIGIYAFGAFALGRLFEELNSRWSHWTRDRDRGLLVSAHRQRA